MNHYNHEPTFRRLPLALLVVGVVMFLTILWCAWGCGSAYHEVRPPHSAVTHEVSEPVLGEDSKPLLDGKGEPVMRTVKTTGEGEGASMKSRGTEATGDFKTSVPPYQMPGGGGSKGGGKASSEYEVIGGVPIVPILFGLASLLSFGAAVYFVRLGPRHLRDAGIAAGAGVAFGAVAWMPALLPLAGAGIVAMLVLWMLANRKRFQDREAARAMLEAGTKVAGPAFRDEVEKVSDRPSDLEIFDRLRRMDRL